MNKFLPVLASLSLLLPGAAAADSTEAACVIYPAGEDHAHAMIPCMFSQRQGHVTLRRSDGVVHELAPVGDQPGNYVDQRERSVYRQSGLGDQGQIFRFPDESVYVYWDTSVLEPGGKDNPTAPFTTKDYDATALLSCRAAGQAQAGRCPAGVLRMEAGQASVVVRNQAGEQFTINFMSDYVNAANREVEAQLEGDLWILRFANGEVWEVPLALIEGG